MLTQKEMQRRAEFQFNAMVRLYKGLKSRDAGSATLGGYETGIYALGSVLGMEDEEIDALLEGGEQDD